VEKMKNINMFDNNFIVVKNFLSKTNIKKILKDIDFEIKTNFCPTVPKYQTYPDLFNKYKNKEHWKNYFDSLNNLINNFEKHYVLHSCWANVVKSKSTYCIHTHNTDISTVYYIKNLYKEFGTYFNVDQKEFIIPGEENSLIIFNGKLPHSTTMPPETICKKNPRYTLVSDFILK
jgi:hypothetical protein